MLLKVMCLVLAMACRGAAGQGEGEGSSVLRALPLPGARMRLCLAGGAGGECAGVLWRRQWVVARAACLRSRLLHEVVALRAAEPLRCDHLRHGPEPYSARKLRMWFTSPAWCADGALVLAALDRRYDDADLEPLANSSAERGPLARVEPWMEAVYARHPLAAAVSYRHESGLFSSPLRMFLTTVLLPSLSFAVLFVLVVFHTGTAPDRELPYETLAAEKAEDNPVPIVDSEGV